MGLYHRLLFASPFRLYAVMTTKQLNFFEKMLAFSGCLLWLGLYLHN